MFLSLSMASRSLLLAGFLYLLALGASGAVSSSGTSDPSPLRAISDLKDSIVKMLGFKTDGVKVSGFDVRDARVGQSVAYEFDIEVDKKVIPIKLLEEVKRWDSVNLPDSNLEREGDGTGLVDRRRLANSRVPPALPPFQLAGPLELWIHDADDIRLSLPHDVDAGMLKKVLLSDGAVVTVKGAKSVSLRLPLQLPLPLNRTQLNGRRVASGLLAIAEAIHQAARESGESLLSLRIVGPTSLTSSPTMSPNEKLKLKRLAPGLVELSSRTVPATTEDNRAHKLTLWPLTSLNGSAANIRGFEELLASVLGQKGEEEGSFKLLRAEVSARNYMKTGFTIEKELKDGEVDFSGYPEWKTRPEKSRTHFEVLARIEENGEVIPERIAPVQPFQIAHSVLHSVQSGNVSSSRASIVYPPQTYFTL